MFTCCLKLWVTEQITPGALGMLAWRATATEHGGMCKGKCLTSVAKKVVSFLSWADFCNIVYMISYTYIIVSFHHSTYCIAYSATEVSLHGQLPLVPPLQSMAGNWSLNRLASPMVFSATATEHGWQLVSAIEWNWRHSSCFAKCAYVAVHNGTRNFLQRCLWVFSVYSFVLFPKQRRHDWKGVLTYLLPHYVGE